LAAAAAMLASRRVFRPMHVHGSVPGVRVEAFVLLELEWGRRTKGRTGELRPAAMAGAGGDSEQRLSKCEGGGGAWGVGRN
jgi:hypothetical protein